MSFQRLSQLRQHLIEVVGLCSGSRLHQKSADVILKAPRSQNYLPVVENSESVVGRSSPCDTVNCVFSAKNCSVSWVALQASGKSQHKIFERGLRIRKPRPALSSLRRKDAGRSWPKIIEIVFPLLRFCYRMNSRCAPVWNPIGLRKSLSQREKKTQISVAKATSNE